MSPAPTRQQLRERLRAVEEHRRRAEDHADSILARLYMVRDLLAQLEQQAAEVAAGNALAVTE